MRQKPVFPVFKETFRKDDKNPFGSYAAYNHFSQMFGSRFIETNEKPFDEAWIDMKEYSTNTKYSLYVTVTKNLVLDYNEAEAFLSFVKEGNDLFIAADFIDDNLLSQINCKEQIGSAMIAESAGIMRETGVHVRKEYHDSSTGYRYFYYPFLNSFYNFDSANTRILGVNEIGKPDYMVFFLGKGRLYLHAAPRTFSNYFFLTNNNYKYLENVLSYLRPDPKNIFWDEYYKKRYLDKKKEPTKGSSNNNVVDEDSNGFSSLQVINRSSSLLSAFWLFIAAVLSYILFNIKRKQKVINRITPNINTSVVFTETVGRLYLQKKDNKNIAEKIVMYFYEYARNSFFLNTNQVNEDFKTALSRKSGLDIEHTRKLFDMIANVQAAKNVTDDELLLLNNLVEKFYKKRANGRKIV